MDLGTLKKPLIIAACAAGIEWKNYNELFLSCLCGRTMHCNIKKVLIWCLWLLVGSWRPSENTFRRPQHLKQTEYQRIWSTSVRSRTVSSFPRSRESIFGFGHLAVSVSSALDSRLRGNDGRAGFKREDRYEAACAAGNEHLDEKPKRLCF